MNSPGKRIACRLKQAFFAQPRPVPSGAGGIWASRATCRAFCDITMAPLAHARFLKVLHSGTSVECNCLLVPFTIFANGLIFVIEQFSGEGCSGALDSKESRASLI